MTARQDGPPDEVLAAGSATAAAPGAADTGVDRRRLLAMGTAVGALAAGAALADHLAMLASPPQVITTTLPWLDGKADAPKDALGRYASGFLTPAERRFLTAVVDRLIPADPTGPSASEAGVVVFLDRQLSGAYGHGAHFFLGGPWREGSESQGYQSRFAPAEFYRHAIAAVQRAVGRTRHGKPFEQLGPAAQDALLKQMESGDLTLDGPITSKAFFELLLQNVREGYFSDPIYGGNRNGAAWAMIGFPGARYDYSPWVTAYNRPVPVRMVGLRGRPGWSRS